MFGSASEHHTWAHLGLAYVFLVLGANVGSGLCPCSLPGAEAGLGTKVLRVRLLNTHLPTSFNCSCTGTVTCQGDSTTRSFQVQSPSHSSVTVA